MFGKKMRSRRILAGALVVWLLAQYMGSYISVFAGAAGIGGTVSGNGDVFADTYNMNDVEAYGADADIVEQEGGVMPLAEGDVKTYSLEEYFTEVLLLNVSGAGAIDSNAGILIQLNFTIPKDIASNNIFTYDFKRIYADKDGTNNGVPAFTFPVDKLMEGNVYREGIAVGVYKLDTGTGKLEIVYDTETLGPSNEDRNAYFRVDCNLDANAFGEEGGEYILKFVTEPGKDSINPHVNINPKEVSDLGIRAKKSHSEPDLNNKTITYTIEVKNTSDKPVDNLVIHDEMSNQWGLQNNGGTLSLKSPNTGVIVTSSENGVADFTIGHLNAGETVEIVYTYPLNVDMGNDGKVDFGINNTITAKMDGKDKPIVIGDNSSTSISDNVSAQKSLVEKSGRYDSENKRIEWTITINGGGGIYDIGGMKLSDILDQTGASQKIAGPITIKHHSIGSWEWKDYQTINLGDGTGFTYTFPDSAPLTDEFKITYYTTCETEGDDTWTKTYKNKVTADIDGYTVTKTAEVAVTNDVLVKSATDYEDGSPYKIVSKTKDDTVVQMQWTSVVNIPKGAKKLVFKDVRGWTQTNIHDFVVDNNNQVSVSVVLVDSVGNREDVKAGNSTYTLTYTHSEWSNFELKFADSFVEKASRNEGNRLFITCETQGSMGALKKANFNNKANVMIDGVPQNVEASREIELEGDYIYKGVGNLSRSNYAGVNEEEHTITWEVAFNTKNTGAVASWEEVTFTDTVHNMEIYGFKAGEMDYRDCVYAICDYKEYIIPVYGKTKSDDKEGFYQTFSFDINSAEVDGKKYNWAVGEEKYRLKTLLEQGEEVYIYYTTKVPDEALKTYNTTETYENTIEFSGKKITGTDTDPITVTQEYTAKEELGQTILSKECKTPDSENGSPYVNNGILTYSIDVNPDGLELSHDYDRYQVEDTLPDGLLYKSGSLRVLSGGTELSPKDDYTFSLVDNALVLMVPDKKPLTIEYEVYMLAEGGSENNYINSVLIPQPYAEKESRVEESSRREVAMSAAGIDGAVFKIKKVDSTDPDKHLEGAVFEAVEYEWDSTGAEWRESGVVFRGMTNADGMLSTSGVTVNGTLENNKGKFMPYSNEATDKKFKNDSYYEIREITAPLGYSPSKNVIRVIVMSEYGDDVLSDVAKNALKNRNVQIINPGYILSFANIPKNNVLTIRKTYWDVEGKDSNQQPTQFGENAAILEIYKENLTIEECRNMTDKSKSESLIQNIKNEDGNQVVDYTVNRDSEPENKRGCGNTYIMQNIPEGDYTVYESKAGKGYQLLEKVYHFKVDKDGNIRWEDETYGSPTVEKEIRNYLAVNKFTINKMYYDCEKQNITDIFDLDKAVFYIEEIDENGNPIEDTRKELTLREDGNYETDSLAPGTYQIDEEESEMYIDNKSLPITLVVDDNMNLNCSFAVEAGETGKNVINEITNNNTTMVSATIGNVLEDPYNSLTIKKNYKSADGKPVEGNDLEKIVENTKFALYYDNGSEVKDKPITLRVKKDDENTTVVISEEVKNLKPGRYYISEVETPDGYAASQNISFKVNENYTIEDESGQAVIERTFTIDNQQFDEDSCRIQISKQYLEHSTGTKAEVSDASEVAVFLYGQEFDKVKTEAEKYSGNVADLTEGVNLLTTPNDIMISPETGKDEYTYYFKEVENKAGYQLTEEFLKLTVKKENNGDWSGTAVFVDSDGSEKTGAGLDIKQKDEKNPATILFKWKNEAEPNELVLTKVYKDVAGNPMTENEIKERIKNPAEFTLYYSKSGNKYDVPIGSPTTVKGVEYTWENLNSGNYKLVETTPPPGFTKQPDIFFKLGDDYEIIEAYIILKDGKRVNLGAEDFLCETDGNTHKYSFRATNQKEENSFTLTKKFRGYDGELRNLVKDDNGLKFVVTKKDGSAWEDGIATEKEMESRGNYQYRISNLEDGTYYIEERDTPTGYMPAPADINGKIIKLTVENGKITANYIGGELTIQGKEVYECISDKDIQTVSAFLYNYPVSNRFEIYKTYQSVGGTENIELEKVDNKAEFTLWYSPNRNGKYELVTDPTNHHVGNKDGYTGIYRFQNLKPGFYQIREKELPGYTLDKDKKVISFSVSENYEIVYGAVTKSEQEEDVVNRQVSNSFYIIKDYIDINDKPVTGMQKEELVSATEFYLYSDTDPDFEEEIKYNSVTRRFEIENIDEGDYYVSENKTPSGYDPASKIKLKVDKNRVITVNYQGNDKFWKNQTSTQGGLEVGGRLENHAHKNEIILNKHYVDPHLKTAPDSDSPDLPLANLSAFATFKLWRESGGTKQDVTKDCLILSSEGKDGIYYLRNMPPGTYTLEEERMEEFYPEDQKISFSVDENNRINNISGGQSTDWMDDYTLSLDVVNIKRHNKITITKKYYDFDDIATVLPGAVDEDCRAHFELYRIEGGKEVPVQETVKMSSEPDVGMYEIKDVPSGTYLLRETTKGYETVPDIRFTVDVDWNITFVPTETDDVVIDSDGDDTERELTVSNHALNGVRIQKKFYSKDGEPIMNHAVFKLWQVREDSGFTKGDVVITEVSQSGCNVDYVVDKSFDGSKDEEKMVRYYTVRDLPEGVYVITEEENPVYATPYEGWYLYFEVNSDKKICNVEGCFSDGGSDGNDEGKNLMMEEPPIYLPKGSGASESLMAEVSVNNYRLIDENHFILDKKYYDETGREITTGVEELVEQTEFVLEDVSGQEIPLLCDKTRARYSVTDLLAGQYTLTETKAPEGFAAAAIRFTITVADDATMNISYTGIRTDFEILNNHGLDGRIELFNGKEANPEESAKPEDPANSAKPGSPAAPSQKPAPVQPALPASDIKTGDDTPLKAMLITALMTLILGAGCIGLYFRRRRNG